MSEKRANVLSQHHDLDFEIDRMRMLAHAPAEALEKGRARLVVERALRSLLDHLEAHFRYEEKDGYMAGLVLEKPHLSEEVKRLRDDHDAMRDAMRDLAEASFEDGPYAALQDRILELLNRVRGHEQAENALIERFMTEEYGR